MKSALGQSTELSVESNLARVPVLAVVGAGVDRASPLRGVREILGCFPEYEPRAFHGR